MECVPEVGMRRSPQKEGVFFCSSSNDGCDLNTSSSVTTNAGQLTLVDSVGADGVDVGNSNLLPDICVPLCDPLEHGSVLSSAVVSRKRKASLVAAVSMLSDQVSTQNRESKRRGTETRSSKSRRRFDSPPNKPPNVPWNMRSRDNKNVIDDDDDSSPLTLHKDEIMLEMTTTVARVCVQRLSQRRYRRSIAALQSTSAISGSATQSSSVAASDESDNPSVRPCSRASAGGGDTGLVVKTNSTALRRQNPNRCSYCSFVSMDCNEVKEHVRTEHQIKCMKCWMTFESREERQEHMLTNHSEFGFYCEDCNMIFRQRECLNDHLATLEHKSMESLHLRLLTELVKTHNLPNALPPQIMDHPFRGELANSHSSSSRQAAGGGNGGKSEAPLMKKSRRQVQNKRECYRGGVPSGPRESAKRANSTNNTSSSVSLEDVLNDAAAAAAAAASSSRSHQKKSGCRVSNKSAKAILTPRLCGFEKMSGVIESSDEELDTEPEMEKLKLILRRSPQKEGVFFCSSSNGGDLNTSSSVTTKAGQSSALDSVGRDGVVVANSNLSPDSCIPSCSSLEHGPVLPSAVTSRERRVSFAAKGKVRRYHLSAKERASKERHTAKIERNLEFYRRQRRSIAALSSTSAGSSSTTQESSSVTAIEEDLVPGDESVSTASSSFASAGGGDSGRVVKTNSTAPKRQELEFCSSCSFSNRNLIRNGQRPISCTNCDILNKQYPSSQLQAANHSSFQAEQQDSGMGPFSTRSYSIQGNGDGYGGAEFAYTNSSNVNFNPSDYQMPINDNTAIEPLAMQPTETFGGETINDAIAESSTVPQDALIDVADSGAMPIDMESLECSDLPPQLEHEDLLDINAGRVGADGVNVGNSNLLPDICIPLCDPLEHGPVLSSADVSRKRKASLVAAVSMLSDQVSTQNRESKRRGTETRSSKSRRRFDSPANNPPNVPWNLRSMNNEIVVDDDENSPLTLHKDEMKFDMVDALFRVAGENGRRRGRRFMAALSSTSAISGSTTQSSPVVANDEDNAKLPSAQEEPLSMQQPSTSTQQRVASSYGWDEVAAYIPNCDADNSSGAAEGGKVGAVKRIYDYLTCDAPEANGGSSMASTNQPSAMSLIDINGGRTIYDPLANAGDALRDVGGDQAENANVAVAEEGPSSSMQQPSSSTQQRDPGSFGWDEVAAYIPNCNVDNSSSAAEGGKVGAVKRIYDFFAYDASEANGVSSMASANAPSVMSFNQFASYPPSTESSMQTSEFANAGAASGNMSMDYWNGYSVPHHHSYNNSFVYYPQQTSYWSNSMHSTDEHYALQQYPSCQFQSSNSSSFQPEQQYCGMGPFSTRSYSIQGNGDGYGGAEFAYTDSSNVNLNSFDNHVPINNTTIEPLSTQPSETFGGGTINDGVAESSTVSQFASVYDSDEDLGYVPNYDSIKGGRSYEFISDITQAILYDQIDDDYQVPIEPWAMQPTETFGGGTVNDAIAENGTVSQDALIAVANSGAMPIEMESLECSDLPPQLEREDLVDINGGRTTGRRLVIFKLKKKTKEYQLHELLAPFGEIERIDLRAYYGNGFITFRSQQSASAVFVASTSPQGLWLNGKQITTEYAMNKER